MVEEVTCTENARVKAEQPCFVIVDQQNRIVEYRLREKPKLYVGRGVQLLKGDRWISGTLEEITQVYQQYLVRVRYSDEVATVPNREALACLRAGSKTPLQYLVQRSGTRLAPRALAMYSWRPVTTKPK